MKEIEKKAENCNCYDCNKVINDEDAVQDVHDDKIRCESCADINRFKKAVKKYREDENDLKQFRQLYETLGDVFKFDDFNTDLFGRPNFTAFLCKILAFNAISEDIVYFLKEAYKEKAKLRKNSYSSEGVRIEIFKVCNEDKREFDSLSSEFSLSKESDSTKYGNPDCIF